MEEIIHLINEMSPYLLLGFFLAGLMHEYIPGAYYTRHLSSPRFSSVIKAALFGVPLPLCSCGVIPTAMSLRREGASKGAVTSFLIATPQTGVDSIIATFSLMGLPFAIARPIAALFTAVCGGALVNAGELHHQPSTDKQTPHSHLPLTHGKEGGIKSQQFKTSNGIFHSIGNVLRYAFVEMMEDIGKWLVIGIIVAGIITVFIPESAFALFRGNTVASMLLVLAISVPMYVCATGSIPIAVALMMKGLTPGAALVLLMAGPACNMASILVVRKVMGTRTLILYLISIVVGAICCGVGIDILQSTEIVDFTARLNSTAQCCELPSDGWFSWLCTAILALLLVNALFIRRYLQSKDGGHKGCGCCHCHDNEVEHDDENGDTTILHITGLNCNHCRQNAEKALLSVPGVTFATVDLASGQAEVHGKVNKEELCRAIESIGFKAE